MYEEGVKHYLDAKRIACKRLFGQGSVRRAQFRPQMMPSNGEIRDALLELAELSEGRDRDARLFAMRAIALEAMRALQPFDPRLIGSVSSGHVRRGSDIDLHVFCEHPSELEQHVFELRWVYEMNQVTILQGNQLNTYWHMYLEAVFAVELSIYPWQERRQVRRSSTDGKPIVRVKPDTLAAMMAEQHPESWRHYQATGEIRDLERFEDEKLFLTMADIEALD